MKFARSMAPLALALSLVFASSHSASADTPQRDTHWLSLINTTHRQPTDMSVVIVPPGYFTADDMVVDNSWVSTSPLEAHPAVRATLEATSYWEWAIDQYETTFSHLSDLTFTTKILGVDATPEDLAGANIIINTGMVGDPVPFTFHLGIGLPTVPPFSNNQSLCNTINTGLGSYSAERHLLRLRNLIIHEFGHCLAVGHTGTSLGASHTSRRNGIFDQHPTDVMSSVVGTHRQCISNLNVQSLSVGYAWLATTGTWAPHPGETFMLKSDYEESCLPESMHRF